MRRPVTAVLSILLAVGFSFFALRAATATAAEPPAAPTSSTTVVTAPVDVP